MSNYSRRGFLGAAGFGLAGTVTSLRAMSSLSLPKPPLLPVLSNERLFTFFQRGGADAIHTLPPTDLSWRNARSSIAQPSIPIGINGVELNADWSILTSTPANTPFTHTPPQTAGHIAWLNQVGIPTGSLSHFTDEQIVETADPQPSTSLNPIGFMTRLRQELVSAGLVPARLFGASVSRQMQRMYRTAAPTGLMAHISSLAAYRLGSSSQRLALTAHLTLPQPGPVADLVEAAAQYALDTETAVQSLASIPYPAGTGRAQFFPANAGEALAVGLPESTLGYAFMQDCELALRLALDPTAGCQIIGVEVGGWDTHNDQKDRRHELDPWLAYAVRSVYDLTVSRPNHFSILVASEFGRRNVVNGSAGTDHGRGCLYWAVGSAMIGGGYSCHPVGSSGPGVPLPSHSSLTGLGMLPVATDFRTVLTELLRKRFLVGVPANMANIIPNFATNVPNQPTTTELGFTI